MSPSRSRRKRLGQHFLTDTRVADRTIAHARVQASDAVLEIGPGTGVLTTRLAAKARRVVAVETDPALAKSLGLRLASDTHVEIVTGDATQVDFEALRPFNKVVANLPYSVSTPIAFRLLPLRVELHVLMFQKEFAERLAAPVGTDAYGRLSASAAYWVRAEYLETVPRGAFHPPPKVASALVRLVPHEEPPFEVSSPAAYETLLRVLFSTRRKTIRTTLRQQHDELGLPSAEAAERIAEAWGRAASRPETVPPHEFGRLTRLLAEAPLRA